MNPLKTIILFLVIVFPLLLKSQNLEKENDKKFSIGISFSPDYSYRNLQLEDDESNVVELRNDMEEPRLGFTTGLVAKYQLNEKFGLESGIQFADKGEKMEMNFEWNIPGENFTVDPAIPEKIKYFYHYYYLGVPIKLNYYFLQKKARMFFSVGSSIDFFLNGKSKAVLNYNDRVEKEKSELNYDFNKIGFVGLASFGIEKDISKRLNLRFEPTFRYSFTPIFNAPLKGYYYSLGANVVLFYKY